MQTNADRVRRVLIELDWMASTYRTGLQAVRERLELHLRHEAHQKAPELAQGTPPEDGRCTARTRFGDRCQRAAVHGTLCGTHHAHMRRKAAA